MTNSLEAISGKVARILNSREIVINIGEIDGVMAGMYFDVLDPKGQNIKDPDTGEILGSMDRPKIRVKVTKVQDKLSLAATFRKERINIGGKLGLGLDFSFVEYLMSPKWITIYENLKTDERTGEDLKEEESYVKTGDPVIRVIDEVHEESEELTT